MMISFPNYQILCHIYESANSLVSRAMRKEDNQPVILKMLKPDSPNSEELGRYQQEYSIIRSLSLSAVIEAYSLETYQNTLFIVLEDFGGYCLKTLVNPSPFPLAKGQNDPPLVSPFEKGGIGEISLSNFLALAIQIAESLNQIHQADIIHKNINPSNIVWNKKTNQLKMIDFGIATRLPRENPPNKNPNQLEGNIHYISPEQTGRMNRSLDYRTDLYSLGVTFYELLTGQLPFNATDPLTIIHGHIAKTPTPINQINPNVPLILEDIVNKLMAKNPENRYQSVFGLKSDLEKCLEQVKLFEKGKFKEKVFFELAQQDFSEKFHIPQKLYGRTQEIKILWQAFERISTLPPKGAEMVLVAGPSGIGKSALVHEIHQSITQQQGYFIAGQFDSLCNVPYSAITQAFNTFCDYLLTENSIKINQWRETLLKAIGENGAILIEVMPHLERIIGQKPAVATTTPKESQNRFHLAFQQFFHALCQAEHPLVLFLDNLQWADLPSLHLLKLLMSDTNNQHFLLIGAYRNNEIDATHPLLTTIQEIETTQAIVHHIELQALSFNDVNTLIADTLQNQDVQALTQLVYGNTQGNPLLTKKLLNSLYEKKLLTFNQRTRQWQWDIEKMIIKGNIHDVMALMVNKISELPDDTQAILKLAACIGSQFDLTTLSVISQQNPETTLMQLWIAMEEGFLLALDDYYKQLATLETTQTTPHFKFQHESVQQAAYSLIPESEKSRLHWQIGQFLLSNIECSLNLRCSIFLPFAREDTPSSGMGEGINPKSTTSNGEQTPKISDSLAKASINIEAENLFEIVDHLNLGLKLVKEQTIKYEMAALNLQAGKKAKEARAYVPAMKYLQTGLMGLLAIDSWQTEYELTLALHLETIACGFLTAEFEQAEALVDLVLQQATDLLDKMKVYEIQMQLYTAQSEMHKAFETGLLGLEKLGIQFTPTLPTHELKIEELLNLPIMTAPLQLVALRHLMNLIYPTYMVNPSFLPKIVYTMIQLSLQEGNASYSAYGYAVYGALLCRANHIEEGYSYGQFALKLLKKFKDKEQDIKAKVLTIFNGHICHWKKHPKTLMKSWRDAYQSGIETGDIEFVGYSVMHASTQAFFLGKPLDAVDKRYTKYILLMKKFKLEQPIYYQSIYRQLVLNLRGLSQDRYRLIGDAFDEDKMLPRFLKAKNTLLLLAIYFSKTLLAYFFKEPEQAVKNARIAEQYLEAAVGLITVAEHNFYYSLALIAQYPLVRPSEQADILRQISINQDNLKQWASQAPMNFQHKYDLVNAEQAHLLGDHGTAMDCYEKAIQGARENGYLQEEALAYELAAEFHFHRDNQKIAQGYLYEARHRYQLWQATAKVKELEKRYSRWFSKTSSRNFQNPITVESNQDNISNQNTTALALDLNSMLKASQALSSEIVLETLLSNMMKLVIESAGAQQGVLILNTNGQWMIEAVYTTELDEVMQSLPIQPEEVSEIPIVSTAIVNYVINTQKKVVLSDAIHESRFLHDTYITQQRPKSVLCLPLVNQSQLIGILYLENNLMVGAFTSERLEILNLLSSQMAISINNAKLYAELRENEKTLKQFLEAVPVGVGMLDKNGKPYYANQRAQKILGKGIAPDATAEQIAEVYQNYIAGTDQLYPNDKLPVVRALQGENVYVDDIEIHQKTKTVPIEAWGTPVLDDKNNVAYALVAFQDITERKQAERLQQKYHQQLEQEVAERTQKLRDSEAQLRQAKEAAEAANDAKSQFLATMSHELRTPLNSILGYAQVLQRDSSIEPRQKEHVGIIKQSGEHLLTLINDILELAKIEAGKMELDKSDFHLPTFLNGINEMVRIRAESKDILYTYQPFDFLTDTPQNSLPVGVHGDEKRLRQVLINLLGNAIKFTDRGQVTFKVGSLSHQKIRFQIEDSGIGIALEQLNTIFERFQQVGDQERQSEGTGLGLAISHHLVELMGSQLQVTSELGQGSIFWFELELPAVSTFSGNLPIETQKIIAVKSETPINLLIVDDQHYNQKLLANLLLPLGFKVILADDGHEGLTKAIEHQPQLILTDLLMPEIDGFELTRQIRQLPQFKDTVVIVMSASASQREHQQSLNVGSHDFLPKPIQAEKLFELLQRHLALEWVYEESQTTVNEVTSEEKVLEPLVLPPLEMIESLFELAMSGDIRSIQLEASQLAQSNEQFAPFATQLQEFANRLQLDKMCDWLESYL
jgi:PAS domain S-box-containing protein